MKGIVNIVWQKKEKPEFWFTAMYNLGFFAFGMALTPLSLVGNMLPFFQWTIRFFRQIREMDAMVTHRDAH